MLRDSRKEVVIKVLKPGVEDTLATDLDFLYLASRQGSGNLYVYTKQAHFDLKEMCSTCAARPSCPVMSICI